MANSDQLQNLYKLFQLLFGAKVIAISAILSIYAY